VFYRKRAFERVRVDTMIWRAFDKTVRKPLAGCGGRGALWELNRLIASSLLQSGSRRLGRAAIGSGPHLRHCSIIGTRSRCRLLRVLRSVTRYLLLPSHSTGFKRSASMLVGSPAAHHRPARGWSAPGRGSGRSSPGWRRRLGWDFPACPEKQG
jgi:hypothetical protein